MGRIDPFISENAADHRLSMPPTINRLSEAQERSVNTDPCLKALWWVMKGRAAAPPA